tara:strand:+ start:844 stop:1293 length:450 start_codon:yes stop_codon:yes gene_type:complete
VFTGKWLWIYAIIVVLGMIVYGFQISAPPELVRMSISEYELSCSNRDVRGKRYLWIKDSSGRSFRTVTRVPGCKAVLQANGEKATVIYRDLNSTLFGLTIDDTVVVSSEDSLRRTASLALLFELFLGLLLLFVLRAIHLDRRETAHRFQ